MIEGDTERLQTGGTAGARRRAQRRLNQHHLAPTCALTLRSSADRAELHTIHAGKRWILQDYWPSHFPARPMGSILGTPILLTREHYISNLNNEPAVYYVGPKHEHNQTSFKQLEFRGSYSCSCCIFLAQFTSVATSDMWGTVSFGPLLNAFSWFSDIVPICCKGIQ